MEGGGVLLSRAQKNLISVSAVEDMFVFCFVFLRNFIFMLQVNLSGYENITVFLAPSVVSD